MDAKSMCYDGPEKAYKGLHNMIDIILNKLKRQIVYIPYGTCLIIQNTYELNFRLSTRNILVHVKSEERSDVLRNYLLLKMIEQTLIQTTNQFINIKKNMKSKC